MDSVWILNRIIELKSITECSLLVAHHLQVHGQRRKEKQYNRQVFQEASRPKNVPIRHKAIKIQPSCHEVQSWLPRFTSYYKNLRGFLSLSEPDFWHFFSFFYLRKYEDNSYIAWPLWLSHEIKKSVRHLGQDQAPRKCLVKGNCTMTVAVMMMKRVLTCAGHCYSDYSQSVMLLLALELSQTLFASSYQLHQNLSISFWEISQNSNASRETALSPSDLDNLLLLPTSSRAKGR